MEFEIKGKVALVTGAASGIGLQLVRALLENDVKGVTLVDVDPELGENAVKLLKQKFDAKKITFVSADVSDYESYKKAFETTVAEFQNLDILVNGAGILDDTVWEREIKQGTIHGMLLGFEKFLPKYKSGSEGVILNIASVAGISGYDAFPVYCATKFAIVGLGQSWGTKGHYERTKVKVLTVCPGATQTQLAATLNGKNFGAPYEALLNEMLAVTFMQSSEFVGRSGIDVIKKGKNGSVWVVEDEKAPYEFIIPPRQSFST